MSKKRFAIVLVAMAVAGLIVFAGCAPKVDPTPSGGDPDPEPTMSGEFTWSATAACDACHTREAASYEKTGTPIAAHAQVVCTGCHTDDAGLSAAHADVEMGVTKTPRKLKTTAVSEQACLACHAADYTPAKTADSTILTDKKGKVVNPHDLPVSEKHSTIVCANCHRMHAGETIDVSAPKACTACHHNETYECGTCHDVQ